MTLDLVFDAFSQQAYQWINGFAAAVDGMPVSYFFGAGMLASVNPCGFIMLPAFAAFYFTAVGDTDDPGKARRIVRALQMGALVTLAFVVTFGLAGVIVSAGGRFVVAWVGWAGLAVGLALVALGLYQIIARRSLFATAFGIRVNRSATAWEVLTFGVGYAIASLSCTLPIFMTIVASVFAGPGSYLAPVSNFLQYAAGMGLVLDDPPGGGAASPCGGGGKRASRARRRAPDLVLDGAGRRYMSVEPNLPQVEVFMQAHCGSCKRVEQFLRKRCVAFSVRDVDQDAAALDELISRGFMSTPVTRIGTHWVAGYKRSLIETLLEASRNSLGHHHG